MDFDNVDHQITGRNINLTSEFQQKPFFIAFAIATNTCIKGEVLGRGALTKFILAKNAQKYK